MRKIVLSAGAGLLTLIGLGATPATAGGPLTCNKTYSNVTIRSNVTVPANGVCVLNSVTVMGNVSIGNGGYFEASQSTLTGDVSGASALTVYLHNNSTLKGNLAASQTSQVFLYGSSVTGDISSASANAPGYGHIQICGVALQGNLGVSADGPDVLVGDPAGGCAANTIRGNGSLSSNSTDNELYVIGNTFTTSNSSLSVTSNTGTSDKRVQSNTGTGGALSCSGNSATFTGTGNSGWGSYSGQCSR